MMLLEPLPATANAGQDAATPPAPLGHADVAGYALQRELVRPAQIVEGDLVVRNRSSRNRVYSLESRGAPSWLLKQGVGASGTAMVANEARAYEALLSLGPAVARHLPRWGGYDESRGVLTLGLLVDAVDLGALHRRAGRAPLGPARGLGRALGLVHRATLREPKGTDRGWFPSGLVLHRPGVELLHEGSAAAIELVKIIQQTPGFSEHLDALREEWRARALVHLDVKWDNCIVWGSRRTRLALVDWEAACMGEPCWDIGSALSHYLSTWISSIAVTGRTPPERFAQLAQRPLEFLQPAIRACWETYLDTLRLEPAAAAAWLLRTVRFTAARLVLTAFETAQVSVQLTSTLLLHLQLALNMLERPLESAVHLLGLPLHGEPDRSGRSSRPAQRAAA